MMKQEPVNTSCRYCDQPLKGRIDKKFCDDRCRNYYHNRFRMGDHKTVREVNSILSRNRNILRSLYNARKFRVKKATLSQLGYRFEFHTHRSRLRNKTCFFNYDHCLLPLNSDCFRISRSAKPR